LIGDRCKGCKVLSQVVLMIEGLIAVVCSGRQTIILLSTEQNE
jgi:hypothetical protein